jgi:hypothetical protein
MSGLKKKKYGFEVLVGIKYPSFSERGISPFFNPSIKSHKPTIQETRPKK